MALKVFRRQATVHQPQLRHQMASLDLQQGSHRQVWVGRRKASLVRRLVLLLLALLLLRVRLVRRV